MNLSVVTHQSTAWCRSHRATSRCTAGRVWRRGVSRGGKRVAWATRPLRPAPLPPFQPNEKAVGQHDGDGMSMKPQPQAALVLIPAQLTLGLFMKPFNRMPPMGVPGQHFERGLRGQVAPEVFPLLGRPLGGTLPHQPACVAVPITGHPPTPHGHELLAQPPFGPPPPANRAPLPARHALEQRVRRPYGCARHVPYTHGEIRAYRHHIGLLPGLQARQKVGVVPIIRIGHHAPMRHPQARA